MSDSLNDSMDKFYRNVGTAGTVYTISTPANSVASYVGSVIIVTPKSAGTLTSTVNGLVRYITITTPALEGTGTATLALTDALGGTYFSQAQAEGVTTNYGSVFPLLTTDKFIVTANGTQSATGTITFEARYEK